MAAISRSWRPSTYELMSEIVSDSTPLAMRRLAARVHALDRLARVGQRGGRIGLDHDDPAGERARRLGAGEMEDLTEALRGDEPDAGALALEHRVRRDGRAVDEVAQVAGRDPGLGADALDAGQHAVGRVARRRRRLHAPLPRAVVVDEEQVGERPSHVHSEAVGHGLQRLLFALVSRAQWSFS
jgi:hypothetical protein